MDLFHRCFLVAAGGAAGSLMRYFAALLFGQALTATFAVNIAGSFLIGVLMSTAPGNANVNLLLGVGFLGGLTTFSAFEYQAWQTFQYRQFGLAFVYVTGSVAAGFLAVITGVWLGERLRG